MTPSSEHSSSEPPGDWNYQADDSWLEKFRQRLNGIEALTVDVFDTAISRRLDAPVDVFALAEAHLIEALGDVACGFAEAREDAEREVRATARAVGHQDIDFGAIYAKLPTLLQNSERYVDVIRQAEIAAEISVLFGIPEILEAVHLAKKAGKPVLFVSDMYFSSTQIAAFLKNCGYGHECDVLVSSETRQSKAAGGQWKLVRAHFARQSRILHIGDNPLSDVVVPDRYGFDTLPFKRVSSPLRRGGPLVPSVLPFSIAARRAALSAPPEVGTEDSSRFMSSFGASWGIVVVGTFLRWLEDQLTRFGIERLFFCARDGWLLHRAWDAADFGQRTGIEARYLYVSRRTLNLAEAALPGPDGGLSEQALEYLCTGKVPVGTLLSRAGLLDCPEIVDEVVARLPQGLDTPNPWPKGSQALREVLRRHQQAILAALQPLRLAAKGYLDQEGLDSRRTAMVDQGWHGSLQVSLAGILRELGEEPFLHGFYYGLWPKAQRRRPAAGWMDGAYGNDFLTVEEQPGLDNAVALLENLHLAPEGSTLGYRQNGVRWVPILQESPIERAQHAEIIAPFQEATIALIGELFNTGRVGDVRLEDLSPAAGLAAIERVALSPTPTELENLGRIRHARDFDHTVFIPVVTPSLPPSGAVTDEHSPKSAAWPVGTALSWLAQSAKAPSRKDLATQLKSILKNVGPRTLRLFG